MKNLIKKLFGVSTAKNYKDCIKLGMQVGQNVHQLEQITIDYEYSWLIDIGNNVVFAPQVALLAHELEYINGMEQIKIGKIIIADNTFIGARAIILPGVTIGKNSIVAAGSVVTKSIPPSSVVAGNPANVIGTTSDYITKNRNALKLAKKYDGKWTIHEGISNDMKSQMIKDLAEEKIGYII